MSSVTIVLGARNIDRAIPDADDLLYQYRNDPDRYYLDYQPITPADRLLPEDLAVTLLMNSRVTWRAFRSLQLHGDTIELTHLPYKPLEHTTTEEREQVAALITRLAQLPGFAASVATKVLHKKRPSLIPILDNQAIFSAYMNPDWPQKPARSESVKDLGRISMALNWIAYDLNRPENTDTWMQLMAFEPTRTRIQLFDSVWWMYFRQQQPITRMRADNG